jgi:hypothetical protein
MSNAIIRDALSTLREHGITPEIQNGGVHVKLRFRNNLGASCMLVISRTPSRRCAIRQSRGQLQRLLRTPARMSQ